MRLEFVGHGAAERERIGDAHDGPALLGGQHALAVGRRHAARQVQLARAPHRMRGERHLAAAAERARHHPLGLDRERGLRVVQRCEPRGDVVAVRSDFDAERALARGGRARVDVEQRADPRFEAEALQAGGRQDDRRVIAAIELRQARVEAGAQRQHVQVRVARAQHRLAAQARRADHGAGRQRVERRVVVRHERIARVLALHDRGKREAFRQRHRHVLQRMHGEIGSAVGQRGLQFLHEQALAADLRQRAIENLVAARRHSEDFHVTSWI